MFKRKIAPKLRKSTDKSLSQPGCSHSNTINKLQLQKTIVLRMQPRQQATLTQPSQCDLQPRLQETHRTTHTGTTIVAKHIEGTKRPQPQPPHTRVPLIAGCSHFTRKNTRFRAPASSLQHTACNSHAAIPMRSGTTASRNAIGTTHTGTTIVAKHIEGTKRPQPQPPHTRGTSTFHRRLQPLYIEKRLLPHNTRHATSCSHSNAIWHHSFKKRKELRTQEQPFLQNT